MIRTAQLGQTGVSPFKQFTALAAVVIRVWSVDLAAVKASCAMQKIEKTTWPHFSASFGQDGSCHLATN